MGTRRIVFHCCAAIVARHSSLCPLFTPNGKHRLSDPQRQFLTGLVFRKLRWLCGRAEHRTARALERRGLIRLCVSSLDGSTAAPTTEGIRLARILREAA